MNLDRVQHVLLDLDGCLWYGSRPAPGAPEVVATLRERGYSVFFLTNASATTAASLAEKLVSLGVPAEPAEVLAPLDVVQHHPAMADHAKVFTLGKPVIADTLRDSGVEVVASPDEARVVLVGNSGSMTFSELTPALRALDGGAALLALNLDLRVPTDEGFMPGTGTIVAALEAASGRTAQLVGKPSRFYFDQALRRFGISAAETVMVGDTPATDVAGGKSAGMATVLVGSAAASPAAHRPDLRVADLKGLLAHLKGNREAASCR